MKDWLDNPTFRKHAEKVLADRKPVAAKASAFQDRLFGRPASWRTRALRAEVALAEIRDFCAEREDLSWEDHGDAFRKLAEIARTALEAAS